MEQRTPKSADRSSIYCRLRHYYPALHDDLAWTAAEIIVEESLKESGMEPKSLPSAEGYILGELISQLSAA